MHIKRIRDLQDELRRVKRDERVLQDRQNRQADRERHQDMPDRQRWVPNIFRNDEVQDMVIIRADYRLGETFHNVTIYTVFIKLKELMA